MIRRLLIPLLATGLLLAAGAGTALGKCEGPNPPAFCAQIVADMDTGSSGGILRAGTSANVRVWVSQGEQPYEATSVVLTFVRVADGTVFRADASRGTEPGLWRADVLLPTGGSWTVTAYVVDPSGGSFDLPRRTMQVAKPPALPPGGGTPVTPTPPVNPTLPALPIALLVAGLAAAGLVATEMRERARRRAAGTAGSPAAAGGSASTATRERA